MHGARREKDLRLGFHLSIFALIEMRCDAGLEGDIALGRGWEGAWACTMIAHLGGTRNTRQLCNRLSRAALPRYQPMREVRRVLVFIKGDSILVCIRPYPILKTKPTHFFFQSFGYHLSSKSTRVSSTLIPLLPNLRINPAKNRCERKGCEEPAEKHERFPEPLETREMVRDLISIRWRYRRLRQGDPHDQIMAVDLIHDILHRQPEGSASLGIHEGLVQEAILLIDLNRRNIFHVPIPISTRSTQSLRINLRRALGQDNHNIHVLIRSRLLGSLQERHLQHKLLPIPPQVLP